MLFGSWTITWFLIANVALLAISLGTYIYNEVKGSDYLHELHEVKDKKNKH